MTYSALSPKASIERCIYVN